MRKKVYCAYVLFGPPGPPDAEMSIAAEAVVESTHAHFSQYDFSQCTPFYGRETIPDLNNFNRVAELMSHELHKQGQSLSSYTWQAVGLSNPNVSPKMQVCIAIAKS